MLLFLFVIGDGDAPIECSTVQIPCVLFGKFSISQPSTSYIQTALAFLLSDFKIAEITVVVTNLDIFLVANVDYIAVAIDNVPIRLIILEHYIITLAIVIAVELELA